MPLAFCAIYGFNFLFYYKCRQLHGYVAYTLKILLYCYIFELTFSCRIFLSSIFYFYASAVRNVTAFNYSCVSIRL